MEGEFKREHGRYFVIKDKDLTPEQRFALNQTLNNQGIPTRECVVIENDWPIYEAAWDMVQRLAEGREQSIAEIEQERDDYEAAEQVQMALRKKADERVAELEAHVEHLDWLRRNVIDAIADDRFEDLDITFYRDDMQRELAPATSLARRDLIKQAEAYEKLPKDAWLTLTDAIECIDDFARETRQKAEVVQRDNCDFECGAYGTYCKCNAEAQQ
ncbi:hypothetical protein Q8G38_16285 [Halomonas venusta]|uniref:hypothetical protein n=1 Tax=Vreelandella venusta TaxID=44935 RepID=UPI00295ED311|nr:hypothetical protein [Halomonas venusta]MDW0360873.1 hypothetical protein [Halomonas venusta]